MDILRTVLYFHSGHQRELGDVESPQQPPLELCPRIGGNGNGGHSRAGTHRGTIEGCQRGSGE